MVRTDIARAQGRELGGDGPNGDRFAMPVGERQAMVGARSLCQHVSVIIQ
jgi:hypothetical protein